MSYDSGDVYLKGPELVAWFEENVPNFRMRCGEAFSRRVNDWKRGKRATIWVVDAGLCKVGLHPLDLPNELWDTDQSFDRHTAGRKHRFKRKVAA